MDRRQFLKVGAVIPARERVARRAGANAVRAQAGDRPGARSRSRRKVEVKNAPHGHDARVAAGAVGEFGRIRSVLDNDWSGNAATAKIVHDEKYGAGMLYAEWPAAVGQPVVELRSRVQTRDRAVDFAARPADGRGALAAGAHALHVGDRAHAARRHRARDDAGRPSRARAPTSTRRSAIYEWVVDQHLPRSQGARLRPRRREDPAHEAARSAASAPT